MLLTAVLPKQSRQTSFRGFALTGRASEETPPSAVFAEKYFKPALVGLSRGGLRLKISRLAAGQLPHAVVQAGSCREGKCR